MFSIRQRSPREEHQERILREFQEATVQRDRAQEVALHAERVQAEAEAAHAEAKRAMRRVTDGLV